MRGLRGKRVGEGRYAVGRTARRRTLAVVVTTLLLVPLVGPVAAHADSDKSGVRALTTATAALAPGQSGWLTVVWTADLTVTDFSTTVTAPRGVTVSYPSTRGGSDTSLYGSDTLVGQTKDFTAFRLAVPYTQTGSFEITVTSTYTRAPGNGAGAGKPQRYSTTTTVKVPVVPASGAAFTQKTTVVEVEAGSDEFQKIVFGAGQTDLADFTVRLGDLPKGLEVAYPGDRSASGLNGSSTLVGRTADYAAVRFLTADLEPGKYEIPLLISFTSAKPETYKSSIVLVVS